MTGEHNPTTQSTSTPAAQLVELIERAEQMIMQTQMLHEESKAFLTRLKEQLATHGVKTTERCLKLVPLAQAGQESGAEVDLMLDRFNRGLVANVFVSLNPHHKRFPCEVVGTGSVVPMDVRASLRAG